MAEGLQDGDVVVLQEADVGSPREPWGFEGLVLGSLGMLAVDPEADDAIIKIEAHTD